MFRFLHTDQEPTAHSVEIFSEISHRFDLESSAMNARFSLHLELGLRFGEKAGVEAKDRHYLGLWSGISKGPGQHRIIMYSQIISKPEDHSMHLIRWKLALYFQGYAS